MARALVPSEDGKSRYLIEVEPLATIPGGVTPPGGNPGTPPAQPLISLEESNEGS